MSEVGALRPLDGVTDLAQLRARLDEQRIGAAPAQARVYNDANIVIGTAALTALTFNSERWDTGNFHSISSNTGRLTAPTAGLYDVGGCVRWATNATGVRYAGLRVNGATIIAEQACLAAPATDQTRNQVSTQYQLAAGDYVELIVFQRSGGNLNVEAAGNFSPEFWIVRLGSQA